MTNKFDKVKNYYEQGLWDKTRVANAVKRKWITANQYEKIVGEIYGS